MDWYKPTLSDLSSQHKLCSNRGLAIGHRIPDRFILNS